MLCLSKFLLGEEKKIISLTDADAAFVNCNYCFFAISGWATTAFYSLLMDHGLSSTCALRICDIFHFGQFFENLFYFYFFVMTHIFF